MGLLCALAVRMVHSRLAVFGSVETFYFSLAGVDGQGGQVDTVGSHIRDAAGFIQSLRHHHRLADGESELPGCFLLQGRGGERRRRCAFQRFPGDGCDPEPCILAQFQKRQGLLMGLEPLVQFRLHLILRAVLVGDGEDGIQAIIRL